MSAALVQRHHIKWLLKILPEDLLHSYIVSVNTGASWGKFPLRLQSEEARGLFLIEVCCGVSLYSLSLFRVSCAPLVYFEVVLSQLL